MRAPNDKGAASVETPAVAVPPDARRVRVVRGGDGLADHLIRLLDPALDAGPDHGLAGEPLLLPHVDVGREDHRVGAVDDLRSIAW